MTSYVSPLGLSRIWTVEPKSKLTISPSRPNFDIHLNRPLMVIQSLRSLAIMRTCFSTSKACLQVLFRWCINLGTRNKMWKYVDESEHAVRIQRPSDFHLCVFPPTRASHHVCDYTSTEADFLKLDMRPNISGIRRCSKVALLGESLGSAKTLLKVFFVMAAALSARIPWTDNIESWTSPPM